MTARSAQALNGICSMAMRRVLGELTACYARSTGHDVSLVAAGGIDVARRVREGEPFDFVVLASDAIASLIVSGELLASSQVAIARSAIGVAVASGARFGALDSEARIRDAVNGARSIGYSTGPSGAHVTSLLERWDGTGALLSRAAQAPPGHPVAAMVASGEVEIGFQQVSELVDVPGIEVAALPTSIQKETIFSAAVGMRSPCVDRATSLLAFLASPAVDDAKRRHGLLPA